MQAEPLRHPSGWLKCQQICLPLTFPLPVPFSPFFAGAALALPLAFALALAFASAMTFGSCEYAHLAPAVQDFPSLTRRVIGLEQDTAYLRNRLNSGTGSSQEIA